MNTSVKLGERAILMRLSIGLPGENRQDPTLTAAVKGEHALGASSGKWVKSLFPPVALQAIKKLDNEARAFHGAITLPFDAGTGILPAPLISEYSDRLMTFKLQREALIADFMAKGQEWVDWAVKEHNGTFRPEEYPGCSIAPGGAVICDAAEWRRVMAEKFYFRTEPVPVPESTHFANTVASLLGTDTQSVDQRVRDAAKEAAQELMRRMIDPVRAMAEKLNEAPKVRKSGKPAADIVFRDSLVGNLQEIARLAPKLNITGDAQIDAFAREIGALTIYAPETLRDDKAVRVKVATSAADLMKRLEGYKI